METLGFDSFCEVCGQQLSARLRASGSAIGAKALTNARHVEPLCLNCGLPARTATEALPLDSVEARICTYECTFCEQCVETILRTCPNCGGGFVPRPIRPSRNWKGDSFLGKDPEHEHQASAGGSRLMLGSRP